jgi:uncharacterized protein (TIGR04255 family)
LTDTSVLISLAPIATLIAGKNRMEPEEFPHYQSPPVAEVICGMQFDPLSGFGSSHFGLFLHAVEDEYPNTEDRAPIDDLRETEEGTTAKGQFALLDIPPLRRVFYLDLSGNFLLQLQPSKFLTNWRRQTEHDAYPRFSATFGRFTDGWARFRKFADEAGLKPLSANQYELTYINHIEEDEKAFPSGLEHVLPFFAWSAAHSEPFLPDPSAAAIRLTFDLPDGKGRLHLSIGHGIRPRDKKRIAVADFTARGPAKSDWSDMESWFSLAHEWIVRGFTDLTSTNAHKKWRRLQ